MQTLLTEKELAQRLACSPRTLMNWRTQRLIPFVKLGQTIRYNPDAVIEVLEKLTVRKGKES